jgi:hypothetical protein
MRFRAIKFLILVYSPIMASTTAVHSRLVNPLNQTQETSPAYFYERFKPNAHTVLHFKLIAENLIVNTTQGRFQRIGPNQYIQSPQILDFPCNLNQNQISIRNGELLIAHVQTSNIERSGESIRFIGKKHIGTYSGAYHNGKALKNIQHCSGAIRMFKDTTYVCWDGLSIYYNDSLINNFSGNVVGNFQLQEKNYGRLGDIYVKNDSWTLFTTTGIFRLNTSSKVLDTIYELRNQSETRHSPILNNSNDIAYHNIWLKLQKDGSIASIDSFESNILDISRSIKPLITTEQGLFEYDFDSREQTLIVPGTFHNSEWLNNEFIIATSNYGMLRIDATTKFIDTLFHNEFNHNSLLIIGDSIFAGATNGLYKITRQYFIKEKIPKPIRISTNATSSLTYILLLVVLFISFLLAQLRCIQKKNSDPQLNYKSPKEVITRDSILNFIKEHIKTVTIDNLRNHFNLSQNALYELCQPESPGKIIRDERIIIVKELLENDAPIETLIEQSGFSKSYLTRKILPKLKDRKNPHQGD